MGLNTIIKTSETKNYAIELPNGKRIIIEDHFFGQFENDLDYLREKYIPEKVVWSKNRFLKEADIPILWGNEKLVVLENEIVCGIGMSLADCKSCR